MFAPKRVPLPVRDVRAPAFADLCTDFFPALLSLVFLPCLIPCKASAFRSFNNVFFIPNMVLSVCVCICLSLVRQSRHSLTPAE